MSTLKRIVRVLRDTRGSVTAEFALLLPAALLLLAIGLGAIAVSAEQVQLASQAAQLSRLLARGDTAQAERVLAQRKAGGGGVQVRQESREGILCVTLTARPGLPVLGLINIEARGCAAESVPFAAQSQHSRLGGASERNS